MSRHLFDLYQLYYTDYGKNALADDELFEKIVVFREKMNRSKWINYENHKKGFINIIPPKEVIKEWENDYKIMQSNMIVGESPSFEILIQTMEEIMKILNNDQIIGRGMFDKITSSMSLITSFVEQKEKFLFNNILNNLIQFCIR